MRSFASAALLGWACACHDAGTSPAAPAELRLVATVGQFGPVGYRDPLGAISPDGKQFATAVPGQLVIHSLAGRAARHILITDARLLHLTWHGNRTVILGQPDNGVTWRGYDVETGSGGPLWPAGARITDSARTSVDVSLLRELSWSADGARMAAIEDRPDGSRLWVIDAKGQARVAQRSNARLGYPAWLPDGRIACLAFAEQRQRVSLPCGDGPPAGLESLEAYGPLAVSPDGATLYLATADTTGFVHAGAWSLTGKGGRQLGEFPRDSYAPSVGADGTVLFKDQDYHTEVWVQTLDGTPPVLRTAFQAETPSWDPTGTRLGITYGTWRRVVDDFHYPDIAQDAGVIPADGPAPATAVEDVVQQSHSEDQGITWSPNRRWIAFHSHQQGSDDIWLRPAASPNPLTRISRLGRGAEVGWPRWSPDGRWIVFDGDSVSGLRRRSLVWVVGVDQETGRVTVPARPIPVQGQLGDVVHTEWLGSSEVIAFSAAQPGGKHALYQVGREGGAPVALHEYQSPQRIDGFGVSPDGSWLAFPQPDSSGRLQIFRVGTGPGARPEQLTRDSADKTQPAVSPDGHRIAYTVWRYRARFWTLQP